MSVALEVRAMSQKGWERQDVSGEGIQGASHPGMGSLSSRMFVIDFHPYLGLGDINSVYVIETKCSNIPLLNLLGLGICLEVIVLLCS